MRNFRDLKVWEKAHLLALAVYRATSGFPREEIYGLTSQMRRCAGSIPANIAEGCGRSSEADFARFLQISAGSASELEYHLILAHDLGLLLDDDHLRLNADVQEVKRMLTSLMEYARSREPSNGRRIGEESPFNLYLTPDA